MKRKLVTLVVVVVGVASGIGLIRTASKRQRSEREPSKNRIQWHVQQAKNEGRKKVELNAPLIEYLGSDESEDINHALAAYTVVVAQPIESRTYEKDGDRLTTWTKFKTVESLSGTRPPRCFHCNSLDAPADLIPLLAGEFLVPRSGGTVIKDGIEVTEKEKNYPFFDNSKNYLMLISLYPSGIALTAGGPIGVFSVDEAENVEPLTDEPHLLKRDFQDRFQSSLGKVRAKVKPRMN